MEWNLKPSEWTRGTLLTLDGELAFWSKGKGPLMLFLHGGPGDEHESLLSLAENFVETHCCVLFDQRGSGQSILDEPLSLENISIAKFLEDISDLRKLFQKDQMILVGHSWGALLGLIYNLQFPSEVSKLVLIGMGPLSSQMEDTAKRNIESRLTGEEVKELAHWKSLRKQAIHEQDFKMERKAEVEVVKILSKAWFVNSAIRDQFTEFYAENVFLNRQVAQYIWSEYQSFYFENDLSEWKTPTLCLYGDKDFEPLEQADLLAQKNPNCEPVLISEAGHLPWLEQTESTVQAIERFLR